MTWDWFSYAMGAISFFGLYVTLKIIKLFVEDWIERTITKKKESRKSGGKE